MKAGFGLFVLAIIGFAVLVGHESPRPNSLAMTASQREQLWDNVDRSMGREPESDRIKREDARERERVLGCTRALVQSRIETSWTAAYGQCSAHRGW